MDPPHTRSLKYRSTNSLLRRLAGSPRATTELKAPEAVRKMISHQSQIFKVGKLAEILWNGTNQIIFDQVKASDLLRLWIQLGPAFYTVPPALGARGPKPAVMVGPVIAAGGLIEGDERLALTFRNADAGLPAFLCWDNTSGHQHNDQARDYSSNPCRSGHRLTPRRKSRGFRQGSLRLRTSSPVAMTSVCRIC